MPSLPANRRISRRDVILGSALGTTAAIAYARLPRTRIVAVPAARFDTVIPLHLSGWKNVGNVDLVMPPEDEQKAAAVYERQVIRCYDDGQSPPIMFLAAYDSNQSGMLMIHRPETCYPGAGFSIINQRILSLRLSDAITVNAVFMSTRREARTEQVLYWTRLGNSFPRNWYEQRVALIMQNLRGVIPDGALIRMSVIDPDAEAAIDALRRFAATLFQYCGRDGRALLAGPANA